MFNVEHVDVITDLANSAVGFAVVEIAKPLNKIVLVSGPGSSDFTGKACAPTSIHWTWDTYGAATTTNDARPSQTTTHHPRCLGDVWSLVNRVYYYRDYIFDFMARHTGTNRCFRRDKAALSSGCKPHPATAPAGSNRSSHGGNEVAEAFD